MATSFQSPGVQVIEQDDSLVISGVTSSVGAMVVGAQMGPINVLTLITDVQDYVNTFGNPDDVTYTHFFTAAAFLGGSNQLYVVRTENANTLCAGATVGLSGGTLTILPTTKPVSDYPLSYSVISEHEAIDGNVNLLDSETFHVYAVGAGPYYDGVQVSIISAQDYALLQLFKEQLAEAISQAEIQALGELWYTGTPATTSSPANPYLSNSPLLRDELIDPTNDYAINTSLLYNYVSFETGPTIQTDSNGNPLGILDQDQFAVYIWDPTGVLQEQYIVSKDIDGVDASGDRIFAPLIINGTSNYIYFFVDGSAVGAAGVIVQSTGQFNLMGADALSSNLGLLTAEISEQWFTNFTNKETLEIDLLLDPDYPDVLKQTLDFIAAQVRGDCFAILSMPAQYMFNINTGIAFTNAYTLMKNYVQAQLNIDSSYSAMYGQYFNIYDQYNQEQRWVPAAGYVGQIIANVDFNNAQWWAPAGLNRGIISGITSVAINPNQAQRDVMYSNRINPIPNFYGQGVVIWGQKTMLSTNSSFNRINVRRLFLYMERNISKMAKFLLFEFNDDFTRTRFTNLANAFLSGIQTQRGIQDYQVVCDTTNNTPDVINNNEFMAQILVHPNYVAEFITLTFTAVAQGVSFSEVTSNG